MNEQFDKNRISRIMVTEHAIERYRSRIDPGQDKRIIIDLLKDTIINGTVLSYRPSCHDYNSMDLKVVYNGVITTSTVKANRVIIVTCNGSLERQKWHRQQRKFCRRRNV